MKTFFSVFKIICFVGIVLFAVLAHKAKRRAPPNRQSFRGGMSMAILDAEAKPYIDQAKAAVPDAVDELCRHRCYLYKLMLTDKCRHSNKTAEYIADIIKPRLVVPLRKAADIYGCAVNDQTTIDFTTDTAHDNLNRQLYDSAGLALESVFVKSTLESCGHVLCRCAPKLASAWGMGGACAAADGPLPIGDIIGVTLATTSTAWCAHDLYKAHKALPGELRTMLQQTIEATVSQCRFGAASAL